MSQQDVTPREALMRLGASTAEAVARVLEMFAPDLVERGEVSVPPDSSAAFSNLPFGAVAASVSYVDGVTGANVFVMTPTGARNIATAMGVPAPEAEATPADAAATIELSELEISAVAELANQMMAAAASAISVMLGQEVAISPPDIRVLDHIESAIERYGTAPHATSTTFLIGGETCRLIQLVPSAFVMRMARAIDELSMEQAGDGDAVQASSPNPQDADRDARVAESTGLVEALTDINLRVWAELGRTRLPLGDALELPLGAVVDLDRAADAPVDLFVNGLRFAQGQLLVTDDGEWAVCLEQLRGPNRPAKPAFGAQTQLKGAGS